MTPQRTQRLRLHSLLSAALFTALCVAGVGTSKAQTQQAPTQQTERPEVASLQGVVASAPVRLRVWGFEVYDARLWAMPGFAPARYAQQAFALELQYLRRLEGEAIASRSLDEMRRIGDFSEAQAQSWLTAMRAFFPDVASGQRITGVNQPGQGAAFWVNGQFAGEVKDPLFARLFFGIWLDPRTSEPKMRAQLLKGLGP